MKISVGIPCRTPDHYVLEAIASASTQTVAPDEILVYAHGSFDPTTEIQDLFPEVKVFYDKDPRMIGDSWNKIYELSCSEWVMMLHADDLLQPNAIELLYDYLVGGQYDLVVGLTAVFSGTSDEILVSRRTIETAMRDFRKAVMMGYLPNLSGMAARRDVVLRDPFRTDLRIILDVEFFVRWANRYRCVLMPKLVSRYRVHACNTHHSSTDAQELDLVTLRRLLCAGSVPEDIKLPMARIYNKIVFKYSENAIRNNDKRSLERYYKLIFLGAGMSVRTRVIVTLLRWRGGFFLVRGLLVLRNYHQRNLNRLRLFFQVK
ncbi:MULTISPECIES: glycosyltransferase family 2 protein [unclassified Thiocapsa]|uniref:glycosyltransferase family 2 protein n=1 Tax=unclassified Thiocapsa TaxID=2641286 RepID=UPI0035AF7D81